MIRLGDHKTPIAEDQFDLLSPTRTKPQSFHTPDDYAEYLLSCVPTICFDHLTFYHVPQGLFLYQSPTHDQKFALDNFSGTKKILTRDLKLVSLDRVSNLQVLLAQAIREQKSEVINALETNFPYVDDQQGTQTIDRFDDIKADRIILRYLCGLGYDGLAFKPMSGHPAQIYLCDPSQVA